MTSEKLLGLEMGTPGIQQEMGTQALRKSHLSFIQKISKDIILLINNNGNTHYRL